MNINKKNKKSLKKQTSPVFTFITTFLIFVGLSLIAISFFTKDKEVLNKKKYVETINEKNIKPIDETPSKIDKISPILNSNKYIKYQGNTKIFYNENLRGFLTIEKYPNFKEPIYQTNNNSFFLNHAGDGSNDFKGVSFMDYRSKINSRKIIIFSHNAKSLNMPFSIFENYRQKEFFEAFPDLTLQVKNKVMTYRIFSVYVDTNDFNYMEMNFTSEGEYYYHLLKNKKKSLYNTGVKVRKEDAILVIQTCEEDERWSLYNSKYLVIFAKRIK